MATRTAMRTEVRIDDALASVLGDSFFGTLVSRASRNESVRNVPCTVRYPRPHARLRIRLRRVLELVRGAGAWRRIGELSRVSLAQGREAILDVRDR